MFTQIIPQIAPITPPNMISVRKVRSIVKLPLSTENIKNARIVYISPIKSPLARPNCLDFFNPINTPTNILTPFITWFTG